MKSRQISACNCNTADPTDIDVGTFRKSKTETEVFGLDQPWVAVAEQASAITNMRRREMILSSANLCSSYRVGQAIIHAIVARSAETPGDQAHGSRGGTRKPTHLARGQPQAVSGPDGLQIAIDDCLNTLQPV
jgi:hypothetical protein